MSTFSFIIESEEEDTSIFLLRGGGTLSGYVIKIQIREDWPEGEARFAIVVGSSFSGIPMGAGLIVTRNHYEVTVEAL